MDTIELADGGILFYDRNFLPPDIADKYFVDLRDHSRWESKPASGGYLQPRLTASYGDAGVTTSDSGAVIPVQTWTPAMLELKSKIEAVFGTYNYCLLHRYLSGSDSVAWHADNEPGVGNVIGSLSLGAARRFRIRHNVKKNPRNFLVGNGTLVIMAGTMQQFWQHEIQKSKVNSGERIHLTFKWIEPE